MLYSAINVGGARDHGPHTSTKPCPFTSSPTPLCPQEFDRSFSEIAEANKLQYNSFFTQVHAAAAVQGVAARAHDEPSWLCVMTEVGQHLATVTSCSTHCWDA